MSFNTQQFEVRDDVGHLVLDRTEPAFQGK